MPNKLTNALKKMSLSSSRREERGQASNSAQTASSASSRPAMEGLQARTAATPGSQRPRLDAWKLQPYREPTVRTGPATGQPRIRSSLNNKIDVSPEAAGRHGTRVTCKELALGWLTTPKFIDQVVNAGRIKEHFSQGDGLRAFDAHLEMLEQQPPGTRTLLSDAGLGSCMRDLAKHMGANGLEESGVLLVTPNHALGVKLRRMNGDKGDRFVVSTYDPNATGVQIKMQDPKPVDLDGLASMHASQMFPQIKESFPPGTRADQMCFKAMSLEGIQLAEPGSLSHIADEASLRSGSAIALALMDGAPHQLEGVRDALLQQGIVGPAALEAVRGARHDGHMALYTAAQKGTPHAETYARLMKAVDIPTDDACQLMTGQRPGMNDTPAVQMAARRNGCEFIESFGRGLAALGLEPRQAGPLLRGESADHTALGTAARHGSADFVRSFGNAVLAAGLQGRDAAKLMDGRYHGTRALTVAVQNADIPFMNAYFETLPRLSIDRDDQVKLLKSSARDLANSPDAQVREAFRAGISSLGIHPSELQ